MLSTNERLFRALAEWVQDNYPGTHARRLLIVIDEFQKPVRLPLPHCAFVRGEASLKSSEEEPEDFLTPCERDIISTLDAEGKRLTTMQVLSALAKADRLHGDSTVIKALAELCQRKKLLNNRSDGRGRGYGLADWS